MIIILKPFGHCVGVINAIEIAKKSAQEYVGKNIYVFGLLVHNEEVKKQLDDLHIHTIDLNNIDPIEKLMSFNQDDVVIFSAHGHPDIYETILKGRGITFVDASCQKVKKCFETIKQAKSVIYIGKKDHPETNAALTKNNHIYFYDIKSPFDYNQVKEKDPLVINQTTLSFLTLKNIHQEIKNHLPEAHIENEICNATLLREEALINIDENVDTIMVVGSKNSSNTMKLYEIALLRHPEKNIYLFENLNDCQNSDISFNNAVIASGTSTPLETVMAIKNYLEGNQ